MYVDLCKSCVWYRPMMATEKARYPAHCDCPVLLEVFGLPDGFPTGIDVVHCDDFQQYPIDFGDVKLMRPNIFTGVSYAIKKNHEKTRVVPYKNNSQNIKIRYLDERKRKT